VPVVVVLVKSETGTGGGGPLASELAKKLGMPPADGTGGSGTREKPGGILEGAEMDTVGSGVGVRMGTTGTSSVNETTDASALLEADSDAGEDDLNRGKGNDVVGTSSIPSTLADFYERNNSKSI